MPFGIFFHNQKLLSVQKVLTVEVHDNWTMVPLSRASAVVIIEMASVDGFCGFSCASLLDICVQGLQIITEISPAWHQPHPRKLPSKVPNLTAYERQPRIATDVYMYSVDFVEQFSRQLIQFVSGHKVSKENISVTCKILISD